MLLYTAVSLQKAYHKDIKSLICLSRVSKIVACVCCRSVVDNGMIDFNEFSRALRWYQHTAATADAKQAFKACTSHRYMHCTSVVYVTLM